VEVEL